MSAPLDHGTYVLSDAAQAYVTFRPSGSIRLATNPNDPSDYVVLDSFEVERLRVLLNERFALYERALRRDVP